MSSNPRNKSGLYPEYFERALRQHICLPVRSEKQGQLSELFVDNQQLNLIQNPDWQVIYGRRGTGKTMLLGVLRERMDKDFDNTRILSVSVTAQDLLVSPPSVHATDRQRALAYFQVFLETVSEQIVQRADALLGSPTFMQRLTGKRKRLADKIQETAIQILLLVQTGKNIEAYSARKETRENNHVSSTETELTSSAGASVNAHNSSFLAKVSAKVKGARKKTQATKTTEDITYDIRDLG